MNVRIKNNKKCVGTIISGTNREINEGKKYSYKEWKISYDTGINILKDNLVNYNLLIHNSGNKENISTIIDYSKKQLFDNNRKCYWLNNDTYKKNYKYDYISYIDII